MTPRALMIVGSSTGAFAVLMSLMADPTAGTIVMVFACGAVFGKGYGVWEERSKQKGKAEE